MPAVRAVRRVDRDVPRDRLAGDLRSMRRADRVVALVSGLTVHEAARELGVSKSRVYKLVERGRIRVSSSSTRLPGQRGGNVGRRMLLDAGDVAKEKEARA